MKCHFFYPSTTSPETRRSSSPPHWMLCKPLTSTGSPAHILSSHQAQHRGTALIRFLTRSADRLRVAVNERERQTAADWVSARNKDSIAAELSIWTFHQPCPSVWLSCLVTVWISPPKLTPFSLDCLFLISNFSLEKEKVTIAQACHCCDPIYPL